LKTCPWSHWLKPHYLQTTHSLLPLCFFSPDLSIHDITLLMFPYYCPSLELSSSSMLAILKAVIPDFRTIPDI
jgi:hypothetical protein